jgi:hypothetical protein
MDYYGWNPKYYAWASSHRLNDDLPDDMPYGSPEFGWHEWEVRGQLPRGVGLYPHWSKSCFCEVITYNVFRYTFYDVLLWLNKYKNPDQSIYIGTGWDPNTADLKDVYTTPRDFCLGPQYALSAHTHVIKGPFYPPEQFTPGKGFPILDVWGPTQVAGFNGAGLSEFIVLGYGFGIEEAKVLADQLVDVVLKSQWGYPFTPGEECYGYTSHYGGPKRIRRPDMTGAFMPFWEVITVGGETVFSQKYGVEPWSLNRAIVEGLFELLHIEEPPPDTEIYLPSWVEKTFHALGSLRLYEYYKFRLKV